jgi:hypothetical protein
LGGGGEGEGAKDAMFQKLALLCHQLSTNSKLLRALEGSPTPFHVHITYFYKGFNQFALCTDLPNPPSWSLEYRIKCLSLSGKTNKSHVGHYVQVYHIISNIIGFGKFLLERPTLYELGESGKKHSEKY